MDHCIKNTNDIIRLNMIFANEIIGNEDKSFITKLIKPVMSYMTLFLDDADFISPDHLMLRFKCKETICRNTVLAQIIQINETQFNIEYDMQMNCFHVDPDDLITTKIVNKWIPEDVMNIHKNFPQLSQRQVWIFYFYFCFSIYVFGLCNCF